MAQYSFNVLFLLFCQMLFAQDTERRDSIPEEENEHHGGQGQLREMKPIYEIDKQVEAEASATTTETVNDGVKGGND
jgi:hypothetical protein